MIKRVHMDCPVCGKVHDVEEIKRVSKTIIKDDEVEYVARFYYCANAEEDEHEFELGAMVNENLLNARNAYRVKHGLLTSNEIVSIRESYGLSQVDMARLLGWGEATISRYESKAIQDEAYDNMLRIIRDDPLTALEFLNKNIDKFATPKAEEIRAHIIDRVASGGREYLTRKSLVSEYVDFGSPSDSNGFVVLNIDKIEAAISYMAKAVLNLFKAKCMKMLWFADALSVKRYGRAITGLVYIHADLGALPVGHHRLMDLENLNVREEESRNYYYMLHVYPTEGMDYSVLTAEDKEVLDAVINKFKNYNARQIIDYMHKERAYQETADDEIIPFSLAKEIREF